jgi:hypothetical protein
MTSSWSGIAGAITPYVGRKCDEDANQGLTPAVAWWPPLEGARGSGGGEGVRNQTLQPVTATVG